MLLSTADNNKSPSTAHAGQGKEGEKTTVSYKAIVKDRDQTIRRLYKENEEFKKFLSWVAENHLDLLMEYANVTKPA